MDMYLYHTLSKTHTESIYINGMLAHIQQNKVRLLNHRHNLNIAESLNIRPLK